MDTTWRCCYSRTTGNHGILQEYALRYRPSICEQCIVPFGEEKKRDIGFIHYKALFNKHNKRVQNGLLSIVLDYQSRGFKITSAFGDGIFEPVVTWVRQKLHVDLTICAADLHVPRAKNVIRLVKERIRCIRSETLFTKFTKRFTIEMVKRVTVLINLFSRKSGVHPVMSPRQLMFGKKFKTPLWKNGKLVIAYNVIYNSIT